VPLFSYSYKAALEAKKERTSKAAASFGPKVRHQGNPKQVSLLPLNGGATHCMRMLSHPRPMHAVKWFVDVVHTRGMMAYCYYHNVCQWVLSIIQMMACRK